MKAVHSCPGTAFVFFLLKPKLLILLFNQLGN